MSSESQKTTQYENQQELQQLKQIIQQDFLNIIGIAQDVQDAIDFYQQNNEEIVDIQFNRLILQHNLSSAIHTDIYESNKSFSEFITQRKEKIEKLLENCTPKYHDKDIQKYLLKYKQNCLKRNPIIINEELRKVKTQGQFNEKVVEKVLHGMGKTEQTNKEIMAGKTVEDIDNYYIEEYLKSRSLRNKEILNKSEKETKNIPQAEVCRKSKNIPQTEVVRESQCCIIF